MEDITFNPKFIGPIREGDKTSTIRAWGSSYKILPDDVFTALTPDGTIIGNYTCTDVESKSVRDIVQEGVEGHEDYESEQELIKEMSRYYPGRTFVRSTVLQVVHFE